MLTNSEEKEKVLKDEKSIHEAYKDIKKKEKAQKESSSKPKLNELFKKMFHIKGTIRDKFALLVQWLLSFVLEILKMN